MSGRTRREIQHDIYCTRKEMRTQGLRRISCFNGGLSNAEMRYNELMFRLELELKDAKQSNGRKLQGTAVPLPGMEHVAEERAAVLAEEQGAELSAELLKPKADIERKAGEIETHSPLFRGTDASPQAELF